MMCLVGTEMKTLILFLSVTITSTVSEICDYENSVQLSNRSYDGVNYEDGEYFVDENGYERGCICEKKKCMRKCCPSGQAYDKAKKVCVESTLDFNPLVQGRSGEKTGVDVLKEFHLLYNRINCSLEKEEIRITLLDNAEDFHFKMDGKLYVNLDETNYVYGTDKYCVDNFLSNNKEFGNKSVNFDGLICISFINEENHYAFNATCMLISCFFMLLTVAVYLFLPELRTLNGMVMTAYLLSFFVGFLVLALMNIWLLMETINETWCLIMTFVIYFSLLAAFFWMNVMSFDLWAKLRMTNMAHGFTNSKRDRFLMYSGYAFGVPTVLTILLAVLEFANISSNALLPNLRTQGCFIHGKSKIIYLYSPIMLICVANLVFFILTARRIAEIKKQTQMLNKKDTQRLTLYIKLFIVTGINWILEVISVLFPNVPYLWRFTDAYNVLVGLIIFIIFVCKKKIFIAIKNRFTNLRDTTLSRTDTNTTVTSSSSVQLDEGGIKMQNTNTT